MTKIQLIEPDVIFWRTPLKWIVLLNIIILFILLYFVVNDSNNRGFKKIEYKILISQISIHNEKVVLVGKNLNTQKKMILSNKSTLFLSQYKDINQGDTLVKILGKTDSWLLKKNQVIHFTGPCCKNVNFTNYKILSRKDSLYIINKKDWE